MTTKSKIIVLYANKYRMANESTGEINEGVSVNYLMADKLVPVKDGQNTAGIRPAKTSLDIKQWDVLESVPGVYEADLNIAVDRDGKVQLKPLSLTFVAALK